MRFFRLILPVLSILAFLPTGPMAGAAEALPVLARTGPWPEVSRMILYGGRLWFANSVKGRNHNSADIYSLDPAGGGPRYERHLFSQDAGKPAVHRGRLYWPFEDGRFSLGWGDYAVTDGQGWQNGTIPGADIFHVHAMADVDGALLAATSAWRAGLQRSRDGGSTWRVLYDHPTPDRRVSRIMSMAAADDKVLLPLSMRGQSRLLALKDGNVAPLLAWPDGAYAQALALLDGQALAIVTESGQRSVRRLDDDGGLLAASNPGGIARDVVAASDSFWLLSADASGGRLWRSADGLAWTLAYELAGGAPRELLVAEAGVFAAGAGDDGRGLIWGQAWAEFPTVESIALVDPSVRPLPFTDWQGGREELAQLLADPANYAGHGEPLRDAVYRLAALGPPPAFFADLLGAEMPRDEIALIGGAVRVPADHLGRWILFWGMGLAGSGRVPRADLEQPWAASPNRSEKYFQPLLAALVAVERVGQKDRATIDALIRRLSYRSDPLWLTGDVVGVLSSLTGQRFAYDREAWRGWWGGAKDTWPIN